MNVSLPKTLEQFVRQKVAVGDYESASAVIREGLRLFKQRDESWKVQIASKVAEGMNSLRAGRIIPAEQVKAGMAIFKKERRGRSYS